MFTSNRRICIVEWVNIGKPTLLGQLGGQLRRVVKRLPMKNHLRPEVLGVGHVVTMEHIETIADGVAVKTPGDQIFPYLQKNLDSAG